MTSTAKQLAVSFIAGLLCVFGAMTFAPCEAHAQSSEADTGSAISTTAIEDSNAAASSSGSTESTNANGAAADSTGKTTANTADSSSTSGTADTANGSTDSGANGSTNSGTANGTAAGETTGGSTDNGSTGGNTEGGTTDSGTTDGKTDGNTGGNTDKPKKDKLPTSGTIAITTTASKGASIATNGGKIGKKNATLKGFAITNISKTKGSISYKVDTTEGKWTSWKKDGTVAADGKKIEAVKIKLSGKLGKTYDVYYRVYIKTYGWLGWAKNGKKAGTSDLGKSWQAQSIQVKLVKKGKKAPGATKVPYSDSKGWISKMTGNAKLDKAIYDQAWKKKTVKACYKWVKNHKHTSWYGAGKKRHNNGTRSWYESEASRMMFGKPTDCYAFAATFALMTNCLGYDSKAVCGYVPSRSLGKAAHSWVEIKIKGKKYVYDPDLGRSYPSVNFYKFTYKHAPTHYTIDKKKS